MPRAWFLSRIAIIKLRSLYQLHSKSWGCRCFTKISENKTRSPEDIEMMKWFSNKQYLKVVNIFKYLQVHGEVTLFSYNMAISSYSSLRMPEEALKTFFLLQRDQNQKADHYSFGSLISALCRVGRLDEALNFLAVMENTNLKPNIVIMNTLLHGAVTAQRQEIAPWIWKVVEENGLKPTEMTLIGFLRLAALGCNHEEVFQAWTDKLRALHEADAFCSQACVASLAVAYSKCGRPDLAINAIKILADSMVNGFDFLTPKDLLFQTGIQSIGEVNNQEVSLADFWLCPKSQDFSDREKLPNQAKISPNQHIKAAFASTANAYSRKGKFESVRNILNILEILGGSPYSPALIAEIKVLVKKEFSMSTIFDGSNYLPVIRVEGMLERDLTYSGLRPTIELYNALLKEQARVGGVPAVQAQWDWMKHEKVPFVPDVYSYGTLLAAHAAVSDADGAWHTWKTMKEANIAPDEACIVSLISSHARSNKLSSADMRVFDAMAEMQSLGRQHTIATGTATARVLGHLGFAKEAFEILEELKDSGHKLRTRSFNTLLHVVDNCNLGISHSVAVLREMILFGCKPDRKSFNALIANCVQAPSKNGFHSDNSLIGRLSIFFYDFMISAGISPETDTFNVSLKNAIFSDRLSTARDLIYDMRRRGLKSNEKTIITILNAGRETMHSQQEMNWLFEQSILLGARPKSNLVQSLIESSRDKGDLAQAVWYIGLIVTHQLLSASVSLRLIQELESKVQRVKLQGGKHEWRQTPQTMFTTKNIKNIDFLLETIHRFKFLLFRSRESL